MPALDYDRWAQTYDTTRGASPSVLAPLMAALGPPDGRSLIDIGGGTGNFALPLAQAGFSVALCDLSPAMARRAAEKLPNARALAVADAQRLPFREGAFDCAISVNVLGHLPDWPAALREARRVLREGPFVIKGSTRETLSGNWLLEYLPGILEHAPDHHYQPEEQIAQAVRAAGFSRVELGRIHYRDLVDGSLQALKHFPDAFLDDARPDGRPSGRIMNTATVRRLPEDELRAGLDAIRRDHRSGRLRDVIARYEPLVRRYGDGSFFVAYP